MEWIFSGIGVALFILFIELIKSHANKRREKLNKIANRYIDVLDHKIHGHPGIIGLIECGASRLSKNSHLLQVCDIITEQGKSNPLAWFLKNMDKKEALSFIKWQSNKEISRTYYNNEDRFKELLEIYRKEKNH